MKKYFLGIAAVAVLVLVASIGRTELLQANLAPRLMGEPLEVASEKVGHVVPGKYIVELTPAAEATDVASKYGIEIDHVFTRAAHAFAGTLPPGLLSKLQEDPGVVSVVPDRIVSAYAPKKDHPGGGNGGGSAQQVTPSGVARIGAEPGALAQTGNGVGVAIVDTGVDSTHADLNVSPACFYASSVGSTCEDYAGHGTHVAGIVAALNNTQDTVGVAPDATIYSVRVLDNQGYGSDSSIIEGLDWVLQNANVVSPNIKVLNMSLGRPGSVNDNPIMQTAIQNLVNAGVTVVVSAGNDESVEVSQNIPAAYPEVMAIASTTAEDGASAKRGACAGITIVGDSASYFTTDGIGVSISAPGEKGENVKNSCFVSSEGILSLQIGGGTTRKSGTSMSAPHVTGVVALLLEKNSSLLPADVRQAIEFGADRIGDAPVDSLLSGYTYDGVKEGILSAPGALAQVN